MFSRWRTKNKYLLQEHLQALRLRSLLLIIRDNRHLYHKIVERKRKVDPETVPAVTVAGVVEVKEATAAVTVC